jgi:hypothetical protein
VLLDADLWDAEPFHTPHGVFHTIRILDSASARRRVIVNAKWGFSEVPADVKQTAIATVAFTYRREVAAFSSQFNDGAEGGTTYELPPFARAALARYRTMPV